MSTFCKNDWKPAGWSLVAGKFRGTDKTYFYLIRGYLMCDPPLTLQCPAAENSGVYSNPFTIEHVLVRFGSHIDQDTMRKLGRYLSAQRDLKILVGDELRNVTWSDPFHEIVFEEKASPKLREAVEDWQMTWIGEAAMNKVIMKGEIDTMNTVCNCKNEGKSALSEVLFYWHDEVHDRIGEVIGRETTKVREASAKKAFVEQMAAQIVEFERPGEGDTVDFKEKARAKRHDCLCSLLMDWVEVPQAEADEILRLDRVLKDARARLEDEFESLVVRSKVVRPGDEVEWLRAVGIYSKNGLDFDIANDAHRFIYGVSNKGHFSTEI